MKGLKHHIHAIFRVLSSALSVVFVVLLIISPKGYANELDLDNFVQRLKQINSISGSFNQIYYDSVQNRQAESSGTFSFLAPKFMSWIISEPEPYEIIIGSSRIWLYDPILETVAIRDARDQVEINNLFFLIKPTLLSERFEVVSPSVSALDIDQSVDFIYLRPKQKNNSFTELHISVDRVQSRFKQIVIVTDAYSYRKISLSGLTVNPRLNASDFEFKIPEGVEIIDQSL